MGASPAHRSADGRVTWRTGRGLGQRRAAAGIGDCNLCGPAVRVPAMGGEDYYLELCERPVQFEKANPVNCVFFDEANKQVSGGRGEGPAPRRLSVAAPSPRVPGVLYGGQRRVCERMGGARVRAGFQTVSLRVWPALAPS